MTFLLKKGVLADSCSHQSLIICKRGNKLREYLCNFARRTHVKYLVKSIILHDCTPKGHEIFRDLVIESSFFLLTWGK